MAKKKAAEQKSVESEARVLTPRLLDGQRVYIAPDFDVHPGPNKLKTLMCAEGATISKALTAQVDVFLFDDDAPLEILDQAEELNSAGASIRIVRCLSELFEVVKDQFGEILRNPADRQRFFELNEDGILTRGSTVLKDEQFENLMLAGEEDTPLKLAGFRYEHCRFVDSHLKHVNFGHGLFSGMMACEFQGCQLDGVILPDCRGLVLSDVASANLSLGDVDTGHYQNLNVATLRAKDQFGVTIRECEFGAVGTKSLSRLHLVRCNVGHTKFQDCDLHEMTILESQLDAVSFVGGMASKVALANCRLKNVVFEAIEFRSIRLEDCVLENVVFRGCTGRIIDFGAADVGQVSGEHNSVAVFRTAREQVEKVAGFEGARRQLPASSCASIRQLADVLSQSGKLVFTADCMRFDGAVVSWSVTAQQERWSHVIRLGFSSRQVKGLRGNSLINRKSGYDQQHLASEFQRLVAESEMDEVSVATLKVSTSKCPVKSAELKRIIVSAYAEAMGKEPLSAEELKQAEKTHRARLTALRKEMIAELQAGDVRAVNNRSVDERRQVGHLRKAKLSNVILKGVDLSDLDLAESDLSGADLSQANLKNTILRKAKLVDAKLVGTALDDTNLRGANLSNTNLTGATLSGVTFADATLDGVVFDGVTIASHQHLGGADLSAATITNTKLDNCSYDDTTRLPPDLDVELIRTMHWCGKGLPPHERVQNEEVTGPLDFDQFMERLGNIVESARLKKALKMLQADSFQLFSEIGDTSVTGVVKSQSDAKRVYSCTLDCDGGFACCTQNLHPCGGLRGSLCKHLLVLIIGLVQNGDLNASMMDEWMNASKMCNPELDKDHMGDVLLKYKGAEAGKIDWRPTETVPEDFFVF